MKKECSKDTRTIQYRRKKSTRSESMRRDRQDNRVFRQNSMLVLLVLAFLFIFIVFGVDDPIDIYDHFLNIIFLYSHAVSWVKESWNIFHNGGSGFIGWLIEKIFNVEITFGISDVFLAIGDFLRWIIDLWTFN